MSRWRRILLFVALPAVAVTLVVLQFIPGNIRTYREAGRPAVTYPDYRGITIPPNLAPMNIQVLEPGRRFCLRLSANTGVPIEVFSKSENIAIPRGAWQRLLEANPGGELRMDIFAEGADGWMHFDTARNLISADVVDPYVVYRYIPPIYVNWRRISLRQRDLRSFEERLLFDNQESEDPGGQSAGGVCVNCHTFLNHGAGRMLVHIRPAQPSQVPAMILVRDGRAEKLDTRDGPGAAAAYTAWRPDGKLLAFSRNRIVQLFHTAGVETREVVDLDSDLAFYDVDSGRLHSVPQVSRPDRLETFPAWSPDGRYLYFTATARWADRPNAPLYCQQVQYDLQRIACGPATDQWGRVETVVAAAQLGRSVSLPQVSPDGRYLMFCGHAYGSFPVYQPTSDLYLLDLKQAGAAPRRIDEINSGRADSYHSWSSNGRWVIFSSKREDGMFARLYLTHLETNGRFSKPFLMPQEDPGFYGRCLVTFNRAEFLKEPVTVAASELARAMNSLARQPAGAAPPVGRPGAPPDSPWQALK
jgi:hypothetical protein